jgi:hypothetical protein
MYSIDGLPFYYPDFLETMSHRWWLAPRQFVFGRGGSVEALALLSNEAL